MPKQSQMGLGAADNLAYQAACFERASASGHAPRLRSVLPPSSALPRGALLVEEIVGRPTRLPGDLHALMTALARIHALPVPPQAMRAPLVDPSDPMAALLAEVDAQAVHLDAAGLPAASRSGIDAVHADVRAALAHPTGPKPVRLIAFDAHPGNFIVRADGSAVLVDLEKARYGFAALDVAHATLVTSTTWDIDSSAELAPPDVIAAYRRWRALLGEEGAGRPEDWLTARAAMWLWSVTWCAKWRALNGHAARASADGEDWSGDLSEARLARHVRGRVDDYLSVARVEGVRAELAALRRELVSPAR
ncbi:MAG: aminoglycoside phosphotransferase family protein [Gammaproteobacteria bacterium]|nr:aminoglycoside phosphotransferase family protein [Gammaproteobacteria bacterium]